MTQKFNIGDRVVVSNPSEDSYYAQSFRDQVGVIAAASNSFDWFVRFDTQKRPAPFLEYELTRIEEKKGMLPDDIDAENAYQFCKELNPEWRSGEHVAFIEGWHAKQDTDNRIEAWERIAKHPALAVRDDIEEPMVDKVLARLDELVDMELTVKELAPAPNCCIEEES